MSSKIILIGLLVLILSGGVYVFTQNNSSTKTGDVNINSNGSNSLGMRAKDNMVVVMEQKPGTTITASAIYLAKPGYLVIHDEGGKILGASSLLPAGESDTVVVRLNLMTKDGEEYQAMLHNELNGNTTFDEKTDLSVESRLGGPIMGTFVISKDASENIPVSI